MDMRTKIEKLFRVLEGQKSAMDIAYGSELSYHLIRDLKRNMSLIGDLTIDEGERLLAYGKSLAPKVIKLEDITDKPCKVVVFSVNDSVDQELGYIETDLELSLGEAIELLDLYLHQKIDWAKYPYHRLNVRPYTGDKTDRWEV